LLGVEPFSFIMNDSRFDNMPLILETPDESLWEAEIKTLYSLINPPTPPDFQSGQALKGG